MKRLTSSSLQLFVFLVLPLLILLVIVAFGSITLHQHSMREMLVTHHERIVPAVASNLSQEFVQRQTALALWLEDNQTPSLLPELELLFDGGIFLWDDGELAAVGNSRVDDAEVKELLNSNPDLQLLPLLSADESEFQIVILAESGNKTAIGIVSLHSLPSAETLKSLHGEMHTSAYILDNEGRVLYHPDPALVGTTLSPSETADVILVPAPIPMTNWTLIHEEYWQEELSPLLRYSQAAPLVLLPGLFIAVVLVWFGIRSIVRPLQRLEGQATSLDWGNYDAIVEPVGGIEEIQRLQATLRNMVQRIQAAQAGMHNYIGAVTRAQEEERLRLARELHDQTSQALVALNHQVQMLKPYLSDDPEAATLMRETRANITESIEDLRRIVRALRPTSLEELGLVPALQMLARNLDPGDKMVVEFQKQGTPRRLSAEQEIVLYRIAQEALNNAWQHSGATQVWLSIDFTEDAVTVAVRDNGHGFAAPSHPSQLTNSGRGHFGIMGMHERAGLIGAHLQVVSSPGAGATVTVRLPIKTSVLSGQ